MNAHTSNSDSIGIRHDSNWDLVSSAYCAAVNALRADGWTIRKYKKTDPCFISKDWSFGTKGDLKIRIENDCTTKHRFNWNYGFKFSFFEEVTPCDNSNGGVYRFDRFGEMPFMLKLMSIKAINLIKRALIDLDFEFGPDHNYVGFKKKKSSMEQIEASMKACGSHYKPELGRCDWHTDRNRTSKDGDLLEHGQEAYFLVSGRLMRGDAYYDLNARWKIAYSKTQVAYLDCGEIITKPNIKKGRQFESRFIDGRIQKALSNAVNSSNYLRAHQLKILVEKIKRYRIWSTKHGGGWWRINGCGYTTNINSAGLFKEDEALRLCKNDDELTMKAV